ncbi:MAG: tryptophan--tRNA ligase [Firmicutes bacterium]|nr:tryptophan--tRNA ligase [Bacillota bacterium]
MSKKVLFTGIQPSGHLTLGSYLGTMSKWAEYRKDYQCIYSIVDLHTITVPQEAAALKKRTLEFIAGYLAVGLKPEEDIIFVQSNVPQHTQLAWVLNCITYMGELNRMTQFKEKVQRGELNNNIGLFAYPVLQAADILLYDTSVVPIGEDQKQHLELARDIASRFNQRFGNTFVVPEMFVGEAGLARVKSLQEPTQKMSKSDANQNAFVSIFDAPEQIINKFKRAVTDSDNKIIASADKPGVTNLLNIYAAFSGLTLKEAEARFEGKGYGDFKKAVGEVVVEGLKPIRDEYNKLVKDSAYLQKVVKDGAEKAQKLASRKLEKVYKKLGFVT